MLHDPGEKSSFDPHFQTENIDSRIIAAMERLSQAFQLLLREQAKINAQRVPLSSIQIQILVFLLFRSAGSIRVSDLAREFSLTAASVSDSVRVLEVKGLVEKKRSSRDARVQFLHLTPEGIQLTKELSGWANVLREHLSEHTHAQKTFVMQFLFDLIERLQKAGIVTPNRMCATCRFFARDRYDDPETPHHCNLLRKPLRNDELRFDCPEHELMAELT